jgi:hypothetical protein
MIAVTSGSADECSCRARRFDTPPVLPANVFRPEESPTYDEERQGHEPFVFYCGSGRTSRTDQTPRIRNSRASRRRIFIRVDASSRRFHLRFCLVARRHSFSADRAARPKREEIGLNDPDAAAITPNDDAIIPDGVETHQSSNCRLGYGHSRSGRRVRRRTSIHYRRITPMDSSFVGRRVSWRRDRN